MSDVKHDQSSKSESSADSVGGASSGSSPEQSPELETIMKSSEDDLIPVPPPTPKSGVSILAHKIWIGNLDKRLTE